MNKQYFTPMVSVCKIHAATKLMVASGRDAFVDVYIEDFDDDTMEALSKRSNSLWDYDEE